MEKQADSYFGVVHAQEMPGENLRSDSTLPIRSLQHELVMVGIPHAGSWQLSCFFSDPADVGKLISGSSAFSITSLNIWKFMVHELLKPDLENLSITLLACEMSAIVQ